MIFSERNKRNWLIRFSANRSAIQKANHEKEEAEALKRLEEKWNPWLEKAMQYEEQEKKKYDDKLNALKR